MAVESAYEGSQMHEIHLSDDKTVFSQSSSLPPRSLAHSPDDSLDSCPDGGTAAWFTVFGAFLALFCSFGQMNAFGTFQSWYATHQLQHVQLDTISWIGSIQLWVFFFSGGFIGRVFDIYGPRPIMALGVVIFVAGIMATSVATQYYQYVLAQGILFGLGVGMLFYPPLAAISTHFSKHRATAMGIAVAGSGVGGTVYPIMLQQLFDHLGFGWGVRISGFVSLALGAVAVAAVTRRVSRKPITSETSPWINWKTFHDTQFMLLVFGSCFVAFGLFIPAFYIVSYAESRDIPSNTAFYVLAVLNGASVLGRVAPAHLADTAGRFTMLVPCAFLAGVSSLIVWMFAQSLAPIMVYAALYGFFSGAFNGLIVPCIAQISDLEEIGMRIGLLYSIISFPSLAGGPVAGALVKSMGNSYVGLIAFSGSTVIIGSLLMLWAKLKINPRIFAPV